MLSSEDIANHAKNRYQEELDKQIIEKIETITIIPEFKEWALDALKSNNDSEIENRAAIYESQQKTLNLTQRQLDNLTKMCYRELINDEEYLTEKTILQKSINELRIKIKETEQRADNWIEVAEKVFELAVNARKSFIEGDIETKKSIMFALGSNWILKDGKVSMEAHKCFMPIVESYAPLEKEYRMFELNKKPLNKEQMAHLDSVITRWQGRWAELGTFLRFKINI